MKIVLTGATGVVGSALLRALRAQDAEVLVLARNPASIATSTSVSALAYTLEDITPTLAGDIAAFKPNVFIHAGWNGPESSERNRPEILDSNLRASRSLLEIAAESGCARWIEFGSQAEYSPQMESAISEQSPTQPDTAYGAAKLSLCQDGQAFCADAGVHFTWLRLFTCYGREYKPSYVIAYLIHMLRQGAMPELRTPHAVWDCLHADDAARAVMGLLSHPAPDGVFNLASGKGVSVGEMALILAEELHFADIQHLRETIAGNRTPATRRVADIRKFTSAFGWKPQLDIREGLRQCL